MTEQEARDRFNELCRLMRPALKRILLVLLIGGNTILKKGALSRKGTHDSKRKGIGS